MGINDKKYGFDNPFFSELIVCVKGIEQKNLTIQQFIDIVKSDNDLPPLNEFVITDLQTNQKYTLDEINQIINN